MPKNKKKTQKDTKDPQKLKVPLFHCAPYLSNIYNQELGNKAFMNKNFVEALDYYSKAIEADPNDPIFYTNSIN